MALDSENRPRVIPRKLGTASETRNVGSYFSNFFLCGEVKEYSRVKARANGFYWIAGKSVTGRSSQGGKKWRKQHQNSKANRLKLKF